MTEIDALGAWTPPEEDKNEIDEKELWNLDITLTEFILPRLKAFKKMKRLGFPEPRTQDDTITDEQTSFIAWEQNLDDIIRGFETHLRLVCNRSEKEYNEEHEKAQQKIMDKGFKLFAEHYTNLWD
ncbi:MAG TPA: hypothetical protein DCG52_05065 [Alphaproteobacteria bacterium]|nr:hypothetical protein [Alphaproteobacteria bacterium]